MKAIIVGGGIMGLSTAWALARDGHQVDLLEQGPLPNPLASSMDEHRLIRHPYGDHKGYARMIDEAYRAWDLLWADLGQRLYAPTGTLALSGNGADWAQRSAAVLADIGRPMTEIPVADLPRRFPLLNAEGVEHAFWIDSGGVLFAQDIVTALAVHLGRQPGVRLHPHTGVRAVDLEHGRVTTGSGALHSGDEIVVAAGAWAHRLLPSLADRLVPSRQVVAYFELPPETRSAWAKAPMIIEKTGDIGLYLVPPADGRGLKIGDHEFSRRGDSAAERTATESDVAALFARCRSLLRGFESWKVDRLKVCFYTVSEDERFVVEKAGARGWVMSPCSGHGFKFGAVMGLGLARAIGNGTDPAEHARWAAGLVGDGPT
jgi:glycine/D-amino acid oxidase-like deaminating enzyme